MASPPPQNNGTIVSTALSSSSAPPTSLLSTKSTSTTSTTPTSTSTTSSSLSSTSSTPSPPSSSVGVSISVVTASPTSPGQTGAVTTIFSTSTRDASEPSSASSDGTSTGSAAASTSTGAALAASSEQSSSSGLSGGGTIAVAVVVPIVAIVLLILAGLWFWRKRKQRKDAAELRRREMEEYGYNPNNDPTLPAVGGSSANGDESSTMRERDAGYRGWGTTTAQRKPSTTMSSHPGVARSDSGGNGGYNGQPSPTVAGTNASDGQSGDPLVSPATDETVGALGAAPAAGSKRQSSVMRGPSNASSAYSGANRSDLSSEGPLPSGSPPYHGEYMYQEEGAPNGIGQAYGGAWDGQPVIRDVSARRNTRIESPAVVPQQGNAGIAQNF